LKVTNKQTNNTNTLFTHALFRRDKNWLKHVREMKKMLKKRNNLRLPSLNLSKNMLL